MKAALFWAVFFMIVLPMAVMALILALAELVGATAFIEFCRRIVQSLEAFERWCFSE